jgi:hypothetical protein
VKRFKNFIFILIAAVGTGGIIFALRYFAISPHVAVREVVKGKYQLYVNRRPYVSKGVCYNPTPVGQGYSYEVSADPLRPWLVDGKLMQEMGVNTVRLFRAGKEAQKTKQMIEDLYRLYGIRTVLGHWMDYWNPYDYADPEYRTQLTKDVLEMVKTYKDEAGLLFWILGAENNTSWQPQNINPWTSPQVEEIEDSYKRRIAKARIYYSLVDEIAAEIKKIDPRHPIALGNADIESLEIAAEVCPNIDILAITLYRGKNFSNFWRQAREKFDKPVVLIEFGADRFNAFLKKEDEDNQALFLKSQWLEIEKNTFGRSGEGNALGGLVFEWTDEWWKGDAFNSAGWTVHNREGDWFNPAYYFDVKVKGNKNMNEEWWGIVGILPETDEKGINKRVPKKAYYELQKLWRK